MDNKASNTLISKSVQKRLAIQKGESVEEKVELRTTKFDEIVKLKEELRNTKERLDMAESTIEGNDRRHDEDMGYIQHYRQEIAELKKLLKDNNIEIP